MRKKASGGGEGDILSFAEVISALSFAIDLTEGAVPGHALRTCILGMRIAEAHGLPQDQSSALYYALLLKDAGCSNNAARVCEIVGGDDRATKTAVRLEDWTRPHRPSKKGLKALWREVLPGAARLRKLRRVLQIGLTQHKTNQEVISLRCERGVEIVRKLGLSSGTANAIYALDEHWDGAGYPRRLRGEAIPLTSRILAIAQHLDVFSRERTPEDAIAVLKTRSGSWFDPALVEVVLSLAREQRLWTDCLPTDSSDNAHDMVLNLEPDAERGILPDEIDRICEAFADVVDAKSHFTYRHSISVAEIALEIATALDLPSMRRQLVRRAALLHDLGKLAVPNTILDKRGKLTPEEWAVVVQHPRLTREILGRIKPFAEMAEIAGAHHERLDGTGYPEKLRDTELCLEARIIAVADFYGALTEERPYRTGIPHDEAIAILMKQHTALDMTCIRALDLARRLNTKSSDGRTPPASGALGFRQIAMPN